MALVWRRSRKFDVSSAAASTTRATAAAPTARNLIGHFLGVNPSSKARASRGRFSREKDKRRLQRCPLPPREARDSLRLQSQVVRLDRIAAIERMASGQQFIAHHAERVDVIARVGGRTADLFVACIRQVAADGRADGARNAEVHHLDHRRPS